MRVLRLVGLLLTLGGASAASADDFGFESLRQLIGKGDVASVETLLAALPEDLRSHYTLVFSSRSLQDASFEYPRAVLFGRDAHFIVTFNGNPTQHGFNAVETMEFDATTHRFVFREITFADAVQISDPNPARCRACHDEPARPIWDVPPVWPGVYGERYGAGLSSVEQHGMHRFLSLQRSHSRYRYLENARALADRDTYVAGSRATYNGAAVEPPNARLSTVLSSLNVRSILSQLAAKPGFSAHLPVLLAASATNCGPLADFYPVALAPTVAADLTRFTAATMVADRRQSVSKSLRRAGHENDYAALATRAEYTSLRYVAERGLQVSSQHWTLAFERGSYDLSAPNGALTLEQALFDWLARSDADLRTLAAYRTFDPTDGYCGHLRQGSRSSLSAWYQSHPAAVPATPSIVSADAAQQQGLGQAPPVLQQCVACHSSGAGPSLPFADARELSARLVDGHYPRGRLLDEILYRLTPEAGAARMPRGLNIDSTEQRQLEDYFVVLARAR